MVINLQHEKTGFFALCMVQDAGCRVQGALSSVLCAIIITIFIQNHYCWINKNY